MEISWILIPSWSNRHDSRLQLTASKKLIISENKRDFLFKQTYDRIIFSPRYCAHLQYTCTVESHIQFYLYVSADKYISSIRITLLTTSQLSSSSAQHHRAYPRDRRLQEHQLRPGRQPCQGCGLTPAGKRS